MRDAVTLEKHLTCLGLLQKELGDKALGVKNLTEFSNMGSTKKLGYVVLVHTRPPPPPGYFRTWRGGSTT